MLAVKSTIPTWIRCARGLISLMPAGRYRAIDRLASLAGRFGGCRPFVATHTRYGKGAAFVCNLGDQIAREVCFTGRYEAVETGLVRHLLQPGMTFVDVGANWGYFSLLAAGLVGDRGRVLSLEPDPRMYSLLLENIHRNSFTQIESVQIAAFSRAGVVQLEGFDELSGNWGVSALSDNRDGNHPIFQVRAEPLDDILNSRGYCSVDLLKMDIEGAEVDALRGMSTMLASGGCRAIMLELHPSKYQVRGFITEQIMEPLRTRYRPYRIDHSPGATRRAHYGAGISPLEFIEPLRDHQLDAWPHLIWIRDDIELEQWLKGAA